MTAPALPPLRYGVATSAYQVEGGADADGKGPSTWDAFTAQPGRVKDGSSGAVACDSYHRFDEDLALLVELGVDAYRFSVSWPRVQPDGRGAVNPAGLGYYDRVVDRLLAAGVDASVTLDHWDLPLALQEAGGWPARDTVDRFADYAALLVDRLGDRVALWATHNEPWCTAFLGYAAGVFAPGHADRDEALAATHHLLLSHARGAEALRAGGARPGSVGLVLNLYPVWPEAGASTAPGSAVDHVDATQNRVWLDPLAGRGYPAVLAEDLPGSPLADPGVVRDGDLAAISGSLEWLGCNYYTPHRVADAPAPGPGTAAYPTAPPFAFAPRPPLTSIGWEVDERGLADVLHRVAATFPGLPLRVTENGAALPDDARDADGAVVDEDRVDYLRRHLGVVDAVRAEGVPVLEYDAWSLLDNFEWAEGYTQTFGLVSVEPGTLRRVPKRSFRWYAAHVAAARAARQGRGQASTS